ncbi:MAG: dienelactone hydrolase family protein [Acidimicrobiales bacterium]
MQPTRTETIHTAAGETFEGHLALPSGGQGAGVLLIQEVFGVNDYIEDVAERLAGLGYVVLAPDLFWRQRPKFALSSTEKANIAPAIEIADRWDADVGLEDLGAALDHLRGLPEIAGAVGVIGFCFGGTQAFRVAKALEPACAVCYYGSGIPEHLDDLHTITCPTMLHFGGDDPYIPPDRVTAVRDAVADNHHVSVKVHPGAGHAFDNHLAPHFSHPEAAAKAWTETAAFLYMHLGGPGIGA